MTQAAHVNHRARLIGSLALGLLLLAAIEGVHSLSGRGSLYERARQVLGGSVDQGSLGNPGWMPLADLERQRAAVNAPGLYSQHVDPRVGSTFRVDSVLSIHDTPFRTDGLGLRRRGGEGVVEKGPENALRIVVLGASIPFGVGLPNDLVMAQVLEQLLRERRLPDNRPVLCRTVAVPRWGHRNAVSFLLDHWDELRPDIVVYMPIGNDISDTLIVDQSGHRRAWPDVRSRYPSIGISDNETVQVLSYADLLHRTRGESLSPELVGAHALRSDVGHESQRRFQDAVSSLELLALQVERKAGQLLVVRYQSAERMDVFFDRAARRGLRPEVLGFFDRITPAMTLGFDPHPSGESHSAMATMIAERLIELGWVETAGVLPLPQLVGQFADRKARDFDWAAVAERAERSRQMSESLLRSIIEPATGEGLAQIYGGISPEGHVGMGLLALLGFDGPALELDVAPLPGRPDLYPFDITVRADGVLLGSVTLVATGLAAVRLELPPELAGQTHGDVELRAEHWGVIKATGRSITAGFRLRRLACPAAR